MRTDFNNQLKVLVIVTTIVVGILGLFLLVQYIFPFFLTATDALLGALSPFLLAIIIAIIIDPLVNTLEQKVRIGRSLAVVLSLTIVLGIFSVFLVLISSRMVVELMEFSGIIPNLSRYIIDEGHRILTEIRLFISDNPLPLEVQSAVQDNIMEFANTFKIFLGKSTERLINFLTFLPLVFTIIIVSAVATFFISKDKELIINYFINLIPPRALLPLNNLVSTLVAALNGFLRAQLFLVSLTAIQAVIGLYILGFEYPFTIGVLVGLFDLLPILGPGAIFIPWSLWFLLIGNYKLGVLLLMLYAILVIVRQLIEPKILGASIGLHPLATLVSVFAGLRLMGIKGVFIGPIVLLIAKVLIHNKNKQRRT
ncbi:MAG: sporulation integral membrane protein YtvI [Clostridia bacterium]|nr:sporulation integral membrane protein YtvI [Clostridia bacterium]